MIDQPRIWHGYACLLSALSATDCDLTMSIKASQGDVPGKVVDWDGRLTVLARQADLRMTANQLAILANLLPAGGDHLVALTEAVVESHRDDFELIRASFTPAEWDEACSRAWAVELEAGDSPLTGPGIALRMPADLVDDLLLAVELPSVQPPAPMKPLPRRQALHRYAGVLRRLARVKHIRLMEAEDECFNLVVEQLDLGVSVQLVESLAGFLSTDRKYIDWMAEAALSGHVAELERVVAAVDNTRWQRLATTHAHHHWGCEVVSLVYTPCHLLFRADLSLAADLLNQRMRRAATEGDEL